MQSTGCNVRENRLSGRLTKDKDLYKILQQWPRLIENGQKFEFVLWRMEVTVNVNDRVAYSAHNL